MVDDAWVLHHHGRVPSLWASLWKDFNTYLSPRFCGPHLSTCICRQRQLEENTNFASQVSDVKRIGSKWIIRANGKEEEAFDFLIVANGHFRLPWYPKPDIPGLQAWIERGTATHAYWYCKPPTILAPATAKILVIGSGPSGSDIISDYLVADYVVTHSVAGSASKNIGYCRNRGSMLDKKFRMLSHPGDECQSCHLIVHW